MNINDKGITSCKTCRRVSKPLLHEKPTIEQLSNVNSPTVSIDKQDLLQFRNNYDLLLELGSIVMGIECKKLTTEVIREAIDSGMFNNLRSNFSQLCRTFVKLSKSPNADMFNRNHMHEILNCVCDGEDGELRLMSIYEVWERDKKAVNENTLP